MYDDDWLDSDLDDLPETDPDESLFGIDWDDDGKVSKGDDFLSFLTLEDMLSSDKKGSGSCLITLFLLPAYAIALWLKQRGL